MTQISQGKRKHMEALSTPEGIIAAAAMDQRGSLQKAIAKDKGVDPSEITFEMMSEFKTAVSRILTPYASSILLDPEFGLEAARARDPKAGLLLSYETTGYDQTSPGRLPCLIPDWTVAKSIEQGANAIKILLYYSPFEKPEINEIKHAWIERIGIECAYHDIPFFLEFVGYETQEGKTEKSCEYAAKKPEVVTGSMKEFSKPRYNVDVLKVEVPIDMKYVEGSQAFEGEKAYTLQQAKDLFKKSAQATDKPFIYLSAGVSDAVFRESLELAIDAGVAFNGVLCGRATWKDGMPIYAKQGLKALEDFLNDRGVQNIKALNKVVLEGAVSWSRKLAAA